MEATGIEEGVYVVTEDFEWKDMDRRTRSWKLNPVKKGLRFEVYICEHSLFLRKKMIEQFKEAGKDIELTEKDIPYRIRRVGESLGELDRDDAKFVELLNHSEKKCGELLGTVLGSDKDWAPSFMLALLIDSGELTLDGVRALRNKLDDMTEEDEDLVKFAHKHGL